MSSQDPEWNAEAKKHNALTILNLSRVVQPLIMFGIVYWALGFVTGFSQPLIIGLAVLAAAADWLALSWIVKMVKGKDNTIG